MLLIVGCIACVASVSVRFRSKERGTRVKDRAKNGSRLISRTIKTENPIPPLFFAPKLNGNPSYAGYRVYCLPWYTNGLGLMKVLGHTAHCSSRLMQATLKCSPITSIRGSQRRFPPKCIENTFQAIQGPFRSLEMHSKRRYKISIFSVILAELQSFRNYTKGFSVTFPKILDVI